MTKLNLSPEKQQEIVLHVRETFSDYEQQTSQRRARMSKIYQSVSTFYTKKKNNRDTSFKINKTHEIENRILPRIMSKNPKPIVSYKSDEVLDWEKDYNQMALAIQDRLEDLFCKQDMSETLRLWAKSMIRYWLWIIKVSPKYRIKRTSENDISYDELWNEIPVKKVKEDVYETYAWIDVKSRTDMYFDPRYVRLEDMPSIIDVTNNARLSYFTRNKSKFMNLDMLEQCCLASKSQWTTDWYKNKIAAITWIQQAQPKIIRPDTLTVKCFYWLYDLSDDESMKNEKLYEFWTVDDVVLVYACEISAMPYEEIKCFEDTESFFATGFLEPIIWLQDELNRKKNKASEYINKTINPDYLRSPISWIDPRKLNQWHWNIIPTSKDAQTALANFVQIPWRDLNSSYFQEENDFERQIQAATFTINTNTPITQNSLTNTATWAKIQNFETDSVTGEVRKHFEEGIVRLSYKLLQFEFDNMEEDTLSVKKKDAENEYRQIHKEALKDAVEKYEINIEAGSSTYDSEEARRNDALAQWNIWLQAHQAQIPVNLKNLFEKVLETFQWYDKTKVFDQMQDTTMQQALMWWLWNLQQPQAPSGSQKPIQNPIPMNK